MSKKPTAKSSVRKNKTARKSAVLKPKTSRKPAAKSMGTPWAASHLIDERIRTLGDWRGEILAEIRRVILDTYPDIVEECKWVKPTNPWGVPVWSHTGIICTGETYKDVVKLTFARGAALIDPHGLFNSCLDGNSRRAIDIRQGDALDAEAFRTLIQAAIGLNIESAASKAKSASKGKTTKLQKNEQGVVLLSGGNPQIAKAYGDAPVQSYIAAMPGWKQGVGRKLDEIIVRTVPNVTKAVKWNTPFYGIEGQGWFLGFHCITNYIKVAFFRGTSLHPIPPVPSRQKEVRYFHVHEGEQIDETQFANWVKQASKLPGEKM